MLRNAGYMMFRYALIYHHYSSVLNLLPLFHILLLPCRLRSLPNLAFNNIRPSRDF